MTTVTSEKKRAVAMCHRLRNGGWCPRECDHWHPNWRGKYPAFCKDAFSAERRKR